MNLWGLKFNFVCYSFKKNSSCNCFTFCSSDFKTSDSNFENYSNYWQKLYDCDMVFERDILFIHHNEHSPKFFLNRHWQQLPFHMNALLIVFAAFKIRSFCISFHKFLVSKVENILFLLEGCRSISADLYEINWKMVPGKGLNQPVI